MYKGKRILAVIPARGGSKGLPNKNIKELNGKELIYHTIGQANDSELIDFVAVSTEDAIIKGLCEFTDTFVIDRPEYMAKDESPSYEAVLHSIDTLKYEHGLQYDIIVMLEVTSPLRKKEDIDNAIRLFIESGSDSLVCIGKVENDSYHPNCVKFQNKLGLLEPYIVNSEPIYQRQQLKECFAVFGGIYISYVHSYREHKTFYQNKTVGYEVERWQMFEIDDIVDFYCCEKLMDVYL